MFGVVRSFLKVTKGTTVTRIATIDRLAPVRSRVMRVLMWSVLRIDPSSLLSMVTDCLYLEFDDVRRKLKFEESDGFLFRNGIVPCLWVAGWYCQLARRLNVLDSCHGGNHCNDQTLLAVNLVIFLSPAFLLNY